ncbi:MAG: hypothetical protein MI922_22155, partial [Bacteroidales bacterium]|nr:hypothetical protein [Bacteroidales bacterium]
GAEGGLALLVGTGTAAYGSHSYTQAMRMNANHVRIGALTNTDNNKIGYGSRLYFSGGGDFSRYDSDNSDPLWMSRYNLDRDKSELRVNIGDNSDGNDKFVIGRTTGSWYPFFTATSQGKVGIGTSNPNAPLHVQGWVKVTSDVRFNDGVNMKGITWGNSSWAGYYSRVDNYQGNLHLMTDDHFYITDINTSNGTPGATKFYIDMETGNVGIGTKTPSHKLEVNGDLMSTGDLISQGNATIGGDVLANRFITTAASFPDYVFESNYNLMSLNEVEDFVNTNKHLPNMPSEKEVIENGLDINEITVKSVENIENIYLHLINVSKEIESLKKENAELKALINNK